MNCTFVHLVHLSERNVDMLIHHVIFILPARYDEFSFLVVAMFVTFAVACYHK